MKKMITKFFQEEDGMGTLEVVIIVAVLVALAIAFKGKIQGLWSNYSGQLKSEDVTSGFSS